MLSSHIPPFRPASSSVKPNSVGLSSTRVKVFQEENSRTVASEFLVAKVCAAVWRWVFHVANGDLFLRWAGTCGPLCRGGRSKKRKLRAPELYSISCNWKRWSICWGISRDIMAQSFIPTQVMNKVSDAVHGAQSGFWPAEGKNCDSI